MSDIAIQIENLGKRYRYGGVAPLSDSLRADIVGWVRGLWPRPEEGHSRRHRPLPVPDRRATRLT
jgi:hypothetical protein